jgi:hypothetical protein
VLCGAASHPADTLVSKINKLKMEGSLMQKVKRQKKKKYEYIQKRKKNYPKDFAVH